MSFPDWNGIAWGDVPTWGLLIGAGITSWYAARAFGKQSAELTALDTEVKHGQELIEQQARLIEIQSGQLDEQKRLSSEQIGVLDLQRRDLEASLAQRERDARERASAQAEAVTTWFSSRPRPGDEKAWGAVIRNASRLPVFQVRAFFHYVQEQGADWIPADRGGPPEWIRVIPPDADRFVQIPGSIKNMLRECNDQVYVTSIEFTDAAGRRWQRDPRGGLTRIGS